MGNRSAELGLCVLAIVAVVLSGLALVRSHSVPQTLAVPAPAQQPHAPASAAAPAPASPPRTVVFLGDGYTADSKWPNEVGAALGWQVVNLAESGTGYQVAPSTCRNPRGCPTFRDVAPRVAESQPAAVVIAGGEVDGSAELKPAVAATLQELKRVVPQAEIVVLPAPSARSSRPAWLARSDQAIQAAAKAADVTWVDTGSVTGSASSYRGGNLTDQASKELAGRVVAELR